MILNSKVMTDEVCHPYASSLIDITVLGKEEDSRKEEILALSATITRYSILQ